MWYENLDRNQFIITLYNEVPELKDVRIKNIEIFEGGDRVSLTFDMPFFADKVPEKWKKRECNVVSVQTDFFNVKDIFLKLKGFMYTGDIEIIKEEEDIILVTVTGSSEIQIRAEVGMVQLVEAYCVKH